VDEAEDETDLVDQLRNSSRSGSLGAPAAALESKEIVCVFRSVPQPGPVKTAWGELEQHVAVRGLLRDLLTVVNRDFHDDSGHVGRQPDYVRHAGVMAPAAGTSVATQIASFWPSFPFRLGSCHLSPTYTLPPAGAAQIMDFYRQDCGDHFSGRWRWEFPTAALHHSVSSRPWVRREPELSSIDRCA
jgi:hypothetical protein